MKYYCTYDDSETVIGEFTRLTDARIFARAASTKDRRGRGPDVTIWHRAKGGVDPIDIYVDGNATFARAA